MAGSYETLIVETKERVGTITLNRPERRNAISPKMTAELLQALVALDEDKEVGVVVLTGAGEKAFCAGGDLGGGDIPSSFVERHEQQREFALLFKQIIKMEKPLVGRINGHAMGGGLGLCAGCDVSIAVQEAKFGTPEINVGLFPHIIMATLIRVTTHPKRLLEMMLSGERIEAAQAQALGFVNHVVPREQLDEKVAEVVKTLLSKSPAILRLGRRAFYTMRDMEYQKALEYLAGMLSINSMAEDVMEGVSAFIQKRPPQWKGK